MGLKIISVNEKCAIWLFPVQKPALGEPHRLARTDQRIKLYFLRIRDAPHHGERHHRPGAVQVDE